MNAQENNQIVQKAYRLFELGDINGILDLYTEDIEFIFPGPPDLIPLAGTFRGKEQVGHFFALVVEHLQFEQFEPYEFLAGGDKVVTLGRSKGTVKANGKAFSDEWVHVSTLREGKVCRWQAYIDTYQTVADFMVETSQASPLEYPLEY